MQNVSEMQKGHKVRRLKNGLKLPRKMALGDTKYPECKRNAKRSIYIYVGLLAG